MKYLNHSILLHLFVLGAMSLNYGLSRSVRLEDDQTLVVNFVEVGSVSKAPEIGPETKSALDPNTKTTQEEETFALPNPDIKKKSLDSNKKDTKAAQTKSKVDHKKEEKKPKKKLATAKPSQKINHKPVRLTTPGQRVSKFDTVITTSEASIIIHKIKAFWNPPEIAENSGIKMRVILNIDKITGKIVSHKIIEKKGPEHLFKIFEDRILYAINNPNINFLDLNEKTLKLICTKGLEVVFDAETGGY